MVWFHKEILFQENVFFPTLIFSFLFCMAYLKAYSSWLQILQRITKYRTAWKYVEYICQHCIKTELHSRKIPSLLIYTGFITFPRWEHPHRYHNQWHFCKVLQDILFIFFLHKMHTEKVLMKVTLLFNIMLFAEIQYFISFYRGLNLPCLKCCQHSCRVHLR